VASYLRAQAEQLPARVLLIRRTGGGAATRPRALFVARSDPHHRWLERIVLDDPREVLDLDLSGVATGGTVGGEPIRDPLYLVCTNSRHDPCCAEYGLPVARALRHTIGLRAWECSHIGGDRFAGNLACLPDGIFYGQLDPDSAVRAVAAHEDGRLLLEHYRGRSAWPFAVQAADSLARRALDLHHLDDLRFVATHREGSDHQVRFDLADGRAVLVSVREGRAEAHALTCGAAPSTAPTYHLRALETTELT
jgi:(2Fe-2S) ferredoxin